MARAHLRHRRLEHAARLRHLVRRDAGTRAGPAARPGSRRSACPARATRPRRRPAPWRRSTCVGLRGLGAHPRCALGQAADPRGKLAPEGVRVGQAPGVEQVAGASDLAFDAILGRGRERRAPAHGRAHKGDRPLRVARFEQWPAPASSASANSALVAAASMASAFVSSTSAILAIASCWPGRCCVCDVSRAARPSGSLGMSIRSIQSSASQSRPGSGDRDRGQRQQRREGAFVLGATGLERGDVALDDGSHARTTQQLRQPPQRALVGLVSGAVAASPSGSRAFRYSRTAPLMSRFSSRSTPASKAKKRGRVSRSRPRSTTSSASFTWP